MAMVLAAGLAACGSQTAAQPAPQDAIVLAASKTADAGTYKADLSGTVDAVGQSLQMSGTGEFDAKQRRGSMSLSMTGAGQNIDMQMVYAYPIIYMGFPPELASELPTGKSWVKMDLGKLGRQAGVDFGQLMQTAQADPSQGLEYLQGAADVQAVGDEDVRGVPTTHYRGVVDLASLAAKNPELKPSIDELVQKAGISRIPVEVWIDENEFVRRMKETLRAAGVATTMSVDLYDFGSSVNVEEPPATDVVDLGQLIGQQG